MAGTQSLTIRRVAAGNSSLSLGGVDGYT